MNERWLFLKTDSLVPTDMTNKVAKGGTETRATLRRRLGVRACGVCIVVVVSRHKIYRTEKFRTDRRRARAPVVPPIRRRTDQAAFVFTRRPMKYLEIFRAHTRLFSGRVVSHFFLCERERGGRGVVTRSAVSRSVARSRLVCGK